MALAAAAAGAAAQEDDPRLDLDVHRGTQTMHLEAGSYHCLPQPDGSGLCIDSAYPKGRIGGPRLVVRPRARIGLRTGYPAAAVHAVLVDARGRTRTRRLEARRRDERGRRFLLVLPRRLPRRMDRLTIDVMHTDGNGGVWDVGVKHPGGRL